MKAYIVFYDMRIDGDSEHSGSSVDSVFTSKEAALDYIAEMAKEYAECNIDGNTMKEKIEWASNCYHIEQYPLDIPLDLARYRTTGYISKITTRLVHIHN